MSVEALEFDGPAVKGLCVLSKQVPGEGKRIKQTSSRDSYGHIRLTLEPYSAPTAFRVEWRVAEDEVPREFARAAMDGIREGVLEGDADQRLSGALVIVRGGSAHEVDSHEMAFKIAAYLALRDALSKVRRK